MLTLLLVVIFISYIGVGLPDSVLGVAWPAMYREFDLPISFAGYITMTVSAATIVSSLLSARIVKKLGTGLTVAASTLLTAVALLGFAHTQSPAFFFLLAIPLGLGAGSIDTGLNNFVALHYTASQMSFLHCFYGIGVAASPLIMSLALGDTGDWRRGYFIVATIQFLITVVTFLALPVWSKINKRDVEVGSEQRSIGIKEVVRTPGVIFSAFSFFFNCALELTAGSWSASYFVNTKGLPADKAASITMLFYIGLSAGRFVSGLAAGRLGRRRLLRISFYIMSGAVVLFALPLTLSVSAAALFFIGFGVGPVFPNLVHLTPKNFGEDISGSVMGFQQAITYLGIMTMPPLFGILADRFSTALLPYYLIAMLVFYGAMFFSLMGLLKRKKERSQTMS